MPPTCHGVCGWLELRCALSRERGGYNASQSIEAAAHSPSDMALLSTAKLSKVLDALDAAKSQSLISVGQVAKSAKVTEVEAHVRTLH